MKLHKDNKPIKNAETNVDPRKNISHSTAHRGYKVQIFSKTNNNYFYTNTMKQNSGPKTVAGKN